MTKEEQTKESESSYRSSVSRQSSSEICNCRYIDTRHLGPDTESRSIWRICLRICLIYGRAACIWPYLPSYLRHLWLYLPSIWSLKCCIFHWTRAHSQPPYTTELAFITHASLTRMLEVCHALRVICALFCFLPLFILFSSYHLSYWGI